MPKSDKELTAEIAAAVIRADPEHRSGPLKLDQVDEIIREVYKTVRSLEDENSRLSHRVAALVRHYKGGNLLCRR